MRNGRIPVLVLAGFLGSGKTTLLNHLLSHSLDVRIGVVVNDFGSIGVDAMLVGGQTGGVVSMGNGCLCCAVDEGGVAPLLERLAAPESGVEVIVIEASGIAEPGVLVQLVLAAEHPRLTFGGLIEVVDLAEYEANDQLRPVLDRHIGLADLVVLNKADRADAATLDRVRARCGELNPKAVLVPAVYGAVDPRVLFDIREVAGRQLMLGQVLTEDNGEHPHHGYQAVTFATERPVDPAKLMAWLDHRPSGIYRIKGFLRFDTPSHRRRYLLHAVGRYLRFDPLPWPRGEPRRTALELIGTGFDPDSVLAALAACARDTPADDAAMRPVLRYLFVPSHTPEQANGTFAR